MPPATVAVPITTPLLYRGDDIPVSASTANGWRGVIGHGIGQEIAYRATDVIIGGDNHRRCRWRRVDVQCYGIRRLADVASRISLR